METKDALPLPQNIENRQANRPVWTPEDLAEIERECRRKYGPRRVRSAFQRYHAGAVEHRPLAA